MTALTASAAALLRAGLRPSPDTRRQRRRPAAAEPVAPRPPAVLHRRSSLHACAAADGSSSSSSSRAQQADDDQASEQQLQQEQEGGGAGGSGWAAARREIQAQQAAGLREPYPLHKTRQLVETAMLAAVTGLAYTVGNLLRLEGYMAYVLPLPVVVASLRSGAAAGVKTLTCAVLLLLILMGPVRAATYLLVYGLLSLSLGACWALRLPWLASVPLGAAARVAGYFAYIALSSWLTSENLLALMMTNVYSLLDQLSAVLGTSGAPPPLAVAVVLGSLLAVNSVLYVLLLHLLYLLILRPMGLTDGLRLPRFAQRLAAGMPAM